MIQFLRYFILHIVFAQVMSATRTSGINLATVHTLLTLVVCIWMALDKKHPEKTAYALAYIAASEILWRMTGARIFWEFGKYALCLIAFVSIMTKGAKRGVLPFLYLLCLLPSISVLPFEIKGWAVIRNEISFNLSGPLALALCVACCARLRLASEQIQKTFLIFLGPTIGVASIASLSTYRGREIFQHAKMASSFVGSGGFGPNQVSILLGLGAVIAFFLLLENKNKRYLRMAMFSCGLLLAIQSSLTFSRGGLYCAGGALFFMIIHMIKNNKIRNRIMGAGIIFLLAANFIALPALVKFTGGAIVNRFKDTSMTGRESILKDDIAIWQKNPIFGVGPGQSKFRREILGSEVVAHSELSRLLSEHGIFGLGALFLLFIMAITAYKKSKQTTAKALVAALIVWTLLSMMTAAMRTGLGAFAFGFAFIQYLPSQFFVKRSGEIVLESPPQSKNR